MYFFLFVIPTPDNVSGCSEGSPRDVEPAVTCQEFVGVFTGAKIVDKALKLFGVTGANVGSLAKEVLRVADATDKGIDAGRTETGVDEDGAYHLSSGLQEHQTAIG